MKNIQPTPWKIGYPLDTHAVWSDANGRIISLDNDTRTHVVKCVNACAGMDDPVAEVRELKLIASQSMGEYLGANPLKEKCKQLEQALVDAVGAHQETMRGMADEIQKQFDSRREKFDVELKKEPARMSPYGAEFAAVNAFGKAESAASIGSKVRDVISESFRSVKDACLNIDAGRLHDVREKTGYVKASAEEMKKQVEEGEKFWHAARNSWHELGDLPPVGTECSVYRGDYNETPRARITYQGDGVGCYYDLDEEREFSFSHDVYKFRPLQTEKQKTIKEMLGCFDGFFNEDGPGDNAGDVCEKIYDKFIAKKAE